MMLLANSRIGLFIIFVVQILLHTLIAESGNPVAEGVQQNAKNGTSRWLNKETINQRPMGCWNKPWICKAGKFPPKTKRLCCKNRCVDVSSDVNNCGLCRMRCAFTWQCCRGLCIDTNINPFHCGRCDHKCPFHSFCLYGMCGYAQPLPPFPFPFPPKPPLPFPPKPFPPKLPKPPLRDQPPPSG